MNAYLSQIFHRRSGFVLKIKNNQLATYSCCYEKMTKTAVLHQQRCKTSLIVANNISKKTIKPWIILPWGFFTAGFVAGFGVFDGTGASLQAASASLPWGFFTAGFVAGGSLLGLFDGTGRLLCRRLRLLGPGASLPPSNVS